MDGFKVDTHIKDIVLPYPPAPEIARAGRDGSEQARHALARLWLSEGIPWAFRQCPALYEAVRAWLGAILDIDPKEIGITGSGRLGTSLSPRKMGRAYSEASDLDLFVVSENIFRQLHEEFTNWSLAFESGHDTPHNERELLFWNDNNERGMKLIQRGFIDQKMIPNRQAYPLTCKISQTMWSLVERLKKTVDAPTPKSASIRCYRSWSAFVRQVSINLQ